MAWPSRGRRESIIRDESFIFIGRTRGEEGIGLSIVPVHPEHSVLHRDLRDRSICFPAETTCSRALIGGRICRSRCVRPKRTIVKRYSQIYSQSFSMIVDHVNAS